MDANSAAVGRGRRFGRGTALAVAVGLMLLIALGATAGAASAAGTGGAAAVPAAHTWDDDDDAAPRKPRLEPLKKAEDRPDARGRTGEPEDGIAGRALDRGRALIDRYGSETLVQAVLAGALVQVLCLILFRLAGTVLRLAARGFAMAIGVAVAVALLGGPVTLPMSGGAAVEWLDRLAKLVA